MGDNGGPFAVKNAYSIIASTYIIQYFADRATWFWADGTMLFLFCGDSLLYKCPNPDIPDKINSEHLPKLPSLGEC